MNITVDNNTLDFLKAIISLIYIPFMTWFLVKLVLK